MVAHLGERHLVRAPGALGRQPVDQLRAGPALRRAQHDHRPARPRRSLVARARAAGSRRSRRATSSSVAAISPCISVGVRALDEPRRVAVALEQRPQLVAGDPREHRRVGDLVAVQVQDRQHRAVARRVQELVRVPAGGERAGLGLAVADDAQRQQVRVVERRAVGVQRARSRARRPRGSSPGVSGATWLGIPPGNENWRNSRRSPSSSRPMCG